MRSRRQLASGRRELTHEQPSEEGDEQADADRYRAVACTKARQAARDEIGTPLFKSLANTAGILFHAPAAQLVRTIEEMFAMAEGQTSYPGVLVAVPPRE